MTSSKSPVHRFSLPSAFLPGFVMAAGSERGRSPSHEAAKASLQGGRRLARLSDLFSPKLPGRSNTDPNPRKDSGRENAVSNIQDSKEQARQPALVKAPTLPVAQQATFRHASSPSILTSPFPDSPESLEASTLPPNFPPLFTRPDIAAAPATPPRMSSETCRSQSLNTGRPVSRSSTSPARGKLQKPAPQDLLQPLPRSLSAQDLSSPLSPQIRDSLAPPPGFSDHGNDSDSCSDGKAQKRRSWMPGLNFKSRSRKSSNAGPNLAAWVISGIPGDKGVPYDVSTLIQGEKVVLLCFVESIDANLVKRCLIYGMRAAIYMSIFSHNRVAAGPHSGYHRKSFQHHHFSCHWHLLRRNPFEILMEETVSR